MLCFSSPDNGTNIGPIIEKPHKNQKSVKNVHDGRESYPPTMMQGDCCHHVEWINRPLQSASFMGTTQNTPPKSRTNPLFIIAIGLHTVQPLPSTTKPPLFQPISFLSTVLPSSVIYFLPSFLPSFLFSQCLHMAE
jgi:hypothetical protein